MVFLDPVDNFPQTKAGAVVIRRLEQRRRLKLHKARTTSCSSSDASDEEAAASEGTRRPPRPEKTPTPPPPLGREPYDDSSDSNQDPGNNMMGYTTSATSMTSGGHARSTSNQEDNHSKQSGAAGSNTSNKSAATDDLGGRVLTSRRNRHLNNSSASRVRQSRSLNRISELHVVADFSGHEDMLSRYLDSVSRGQTRSRDDSLTSSDGEFDGPQPPQPRRSKVNLRVLEQRLNKIQEECNSNSNNNGLQTAEDGDISDNVSTDGFGLGTALTTKTIIIEDKENLLNRSCSETTSVKSCIVTSKKSQPHLHRAHSCGSLFSLKERALLRKKLSSHVTAAFWDILSHSATASEVEAVVAKQNPPELSLALNSNPLAMFQSTSRCCNLC